VLITMSTTQLNPHTEAIPPAARQRGHGLAVRADIDGEGKSP